MLQRTRKSGFTIVELLVVVTILGTLVGLVTVALRTAMNTTAEKSTRSTLEALSGMIKLIEQKGGAETLPQFAIASRGRVTIDSEAADDRVLAVMDTQAAMRRLVSLPENKATMSKFPDSAKHRPVGPPDQYVPVMLDGWHNPIIFVPRGGLKDVAIKNEQTWNGATEYPVGARVVGPVVPPGAPQNVHFIYTCVKSGNKNVNSGATTHWFRGIIAGPIDFVRDPATNRVIPLGRPFWASAGPDGIFGFAGSIPGGGDNLYSFE